MENTSNGSNATLTIVYRSTKIQPKVCSSPKFAKHFIGHKQIINFTKELADDFFNGGSTPATKVYDYIKLLNSHINTLDMLPYYPGEFNKLIKTV